MGAVDLFIVEDDPFDPPRDIPTTVLRNAMEHLDVLRLNLPVLVTGGPEETILKLRKLEARGTLTVRTNRIAKPRSVSLRKTFLDSLPGMRADRTLPDGKTLGEALDRLIAWGVIEEGLSIDRWTEVPTVGEKTVDRIRRSLREPYAAAQDRTEVVRVNSTVPKPLGYGGRSSTPAAD